jgi:tetratricopeptide (TPR) repeat protein
MGFGKKTDFSTGRTLDLDKTYKNIIQPAVMKAGYECIRADEIQDSGLIDKSMYLLLMSSELVIADISTYNPNAIYELGIRHAVKPYSTIVIKEKDGKIPFDLDHTRIFQYAHLGDDIGADEANRCQNDLADLINSITETNIIDSPMYEFVKILPPTVPQEELDRLVKELADKEKHIFAIVEEAQTLMKASQFENAAIYWEKAKNLMPNETYFIQQFALCKYKSKKPSELAALSDALNIIEELEPDSMNNDPETLGITGAIYKNIYLITKDVEFLNRATKYYGKGFKVRNDYYTGENYALCLDMKWQVEENEEEKIYFKIEARRARTEIISSLENIISLSEINEHQDKKWIYATLSNCYFALGNVNKADEYEGLFKREAPEAWELDTFNKSREIFASLLIK